MEKTNVMKKETKSVLITIRITKHKKQWINEQKLSPTMIFNEAVKELGYKEEMVK